MTQSPGRYEDPPPPRPRQRDQAATGAPGAHLPHPATPSQGTNPDYGEEGCYMHMLEARLPCNLCG